MERRWTGEVVTRLLERSDLGRGITPPDPERLRYRRAAAVLTVFDPEELAPLGGSAVPGEAMRLLFEDLQPAPGHGRRSAWTLRSNVRAEILAEFEDRVAMMRALDANPAQAGRQDPSQRMLAAYIRGSAPALDSQSMEELSASLQAARWLHGLVSNVPEPGAVRTLLDRRRLVEPFVRLAGQQFTDRVHELQTLRKHAGSRGRRPPLAVTGPGGVGKTTLIGRFILDHAAPGAGQSMPFVYLDFADAALDVTDWRTWLRVAASQLAIEAAAAGTPSREADARGTLEEATELLASLARLSQLTGHPTFLFVIDSYEELAYQGAGKAVLCRFLEGLAVAHPGLRAIIASRGPVELAPGGLRCPTLELAELDTQSAVAYVRASAGTDPETAAEVVRHIGGSPFALKLAAAVLAQEGGPLTDLPTSRRVLTVGENAIQAALYSRLVAHIPDPDVRRLMPLMLVLRRVTPEVIDEVLTPAIEFDADARSPAELFESIRRESALVSVGEDDGVLRYRPDLRRALLPFVQQESPAEVRALDTRAVDFYSVRDGTEARAEELYHRLRLGQNVDDRWVAGVERYLRGAETELPARSRATLASRLGSELDPSLLAQLSDVTWERDAARGAADLLAVGEPGAALERLRQRSSRGPDSPLYALEARALAQLGRIAEARALIDAAIDTTRRDGSPGAIVVLLELAADLAGEDAVSAGRYLDEAVGAASYEPDCIRLLGLDLRRLRLQTARTDREDPGAVHYLTERLVAQFDAASDAQLAAHEDLARAVAAEVGRDAPQVLARALRVAGVGRLDQERRGDIASALADDNAPELFDVLAGRLEPGPEDEARQAWARALDQAQLVGRLDELFKSALAAAPGSPSVRHAVALALGA
ncbi:hypothetical protein OM076_13665 [Solirubrobacter ginsenosidimutans]|uniref:Orc1-like AAA ATPase domain-containing protein n=1 Tax=Solirubrobacter ginsenosidimutans TaxID=490573 RepID=A0A9X3MRV2_9ACTN|nr:hypothetical protein [Solirubrobacter ginsenosidimutans]MDA0161320.1 hypothetical protein [Solirubrobacter ginsenosidimutans]